MKIKTFLIEDDYNDYEGYLDKFDNKVNKWLEENPNITIKDIKFASNSSQSGEGDFRATITLMFLYD